MGLAWCSCLRARLVLGRRWPQNSLLKVGVSPALSELPSRSVCAWSFVVLASHVYFKFFFFLAVLGLCCCAQAFSSCGEQGLLTAVASLVAERGF